MVGYSPHGLPEATPKPHFGLLGPTVSALGFRVQGLGFRLQELHGSSWKLHTSVHPAGREDGWRPSLELL